MKERLVKGRHVRGVLDLLEERGNPELPDLPLPGADLLRKKVYPTTWYQLQAYEGLLESVHRYVFDGSEAAGQKMGRMLAAHFLSDRHEALDASVISAAELLSWYWRSHFNFGEVLYEACDVEERHGVRIRMTGYPDMSSCHGHTWMGWSAEIVLRACACEAQLRVEERPWMHNSVLTFTLTIP